MKKIDTTQWGEFLLGNLFIVEKGKRLTKANMKPGNINYIGATAFDNGITAHIANNEHLHPAGTITVCYNGSVGQTFYQTTPYWATDDVNVLYPRFEMKPQVAFLLYQFYELWGKNTLLSINGQRTKWKIQKFCSQEMRKATPIGHIWRST